MASEDHTARHGQARAKDESSISRLENQLEGMNLHNTEDVDQTISYAPAVTKEIVKPVVHEQVEEHITRETHVHDVYHKILPVKDVEVLPARHWVPGPDGRLIQVDEKDVYSGVAFGADQATTTTISEVKQDQVQTNQVVYGDTSSANSHIDRHIAISEPEVLPGQVKQVYQTQVHQPLITHHHAGLEQVDQRQINQGTFGAVNQQYTDESLTPQRETTLGQGYQSEIQPQELSQHHITRKPVNQDHSNTGHIAFSDVQLPASSYEAGPSTIQHAPATQLGADTSNVYPADNYRAGPDQNIRSLHRSSQPSSSPYQAYETDPSRMNQIHHNQEPQQRIMTDQVDSRQVGHGQAQQPSHYTADRDAGGRGHETQGLFHHRHAADDHARDNQTYQEHGMRHDDSKHHRHQENVHDSGKHHSLGHRSDEDPTGAPHQSSDQGATHQSSDPNTDGAPVSPGLLDPYRVKNGPVHHADRDASNNPLDKPLPDLPETTVQKIAGHSILTTEDSKGHTKLHKEPKDSRYTTH